MNVSWTVWVPLAPVGHEPCTLGLVSTLPRVEGAMKQWILPYQKTPVTQAKRSSLFDCPRVLLSSSFACFDTTPICSHLRRVELKHGGGGGRSGSFVYFESNSRL